MSLGTLKLSIVAIKNPLQEIFSAIFDYDYLGNATYFPVSDLSELLPITSVARYRHRRAECKGNLNLKNPGIFFEQQACQ